MSWHYSAFIIKPQLQQQHDQQQQQQQREREDLFWLTSTLSYILDARISHADKCLFSLTPRHQYSEPQYPAVQWYIYLLRLPNTVRCLIRNIELV